MKTVHRNESYLSARADGEMRTAAVIIAVVLMGLLLLVVFGDAVIPSLVLPGGAARIRPVSSHR